MRALLLSSLLLLFLGGCVTSNPYTSRSQLMLIDKKEELKMGREASEEILKNSKKSSNMQATRRVMEVGTKIARVAEQSDFAWEFHLIEDPSINAFCLPGGKVFVYTGILTLVESDDELAVVMGHEIAHAIARHGAERLSVSMASELGRNLIGIALDMKQPQSKKLFDTAYGVGMNVGVMLPYSRAQELEADRIGLLLMKRAGYNPNAALTFWEKMRANQGGGKGGDFLSTHPSDSKRIEAIRQAIPSL